MSIRFHRSGLIASGMNDKAVAFAAEVAQYTGANMGFETRWGFQLGGTFTTLHWFSDFATMADFEAAVGSTLTDEGYRKLLADAADCFATGSINDTIVVMA